MIHIYFDMDGVLAKYDRNAYMEDPETHERLFETKNKHYFRYVPADDKMTNVLFHLTDEIHHQKSGIDIKTHVISTLSKKSSAFIEQYDDKVAWLRDNIKNFPTEEFYPALGEKRDIAVLIRGKKLNTTDILIDDYNVNLKSWRDAGGTAIKYLNGVNSAESWDGPYIDQAMSSSEIIRMLEVLARANSAFSDKD